MQKGQRANDLRPLRDWGCPHLVDLDQIPTSVASVRFDQDQAYLAAVAFALARRGPFVAPRTKPFFFAYRARAAFRAFALRPAGVSFAAAANPPARFVPGFRNLR